MLIALALLAATMVALFLVVAHGYSQERQMAAERRDWTAERRELLNRVQRPELIPVANNREPFEFPDQKPDEWARAGQIDISDDYGIGEDGS